MASIVPGTYRSSNTRAEQRNLRQGNHVNKRLVALALFSGPRKYCCLPEGPRNRGQLEASTVEASIAQVSMGRHWSSISRVGAPTWRQRSAHPSNLACSHRLHEDLTELSLGSGTGDWQLEKIEFAPTGQPLSSETRVATEGRIMKYCAKQRFTPCNRLLFDANWARFEWEHQKLGNLYTSCESLENRAGGDLQGILPRFIDA